MPMKNYFVHPLADVHSNNIGTETNIWQFAVILEDAVIGDQCTIAAHCFIENDVSIGDRVTLKCGVYLWDGLRVGDDVFIGPNATFTNDKYPKSKNKDYKRLVTTIGRGASIGAGAVILPGITIGESASVAAGAVVTKNVEAGTTVAGNPARPFT